MADELTLFSLSGSGGRSVARAAKARSTQRAGVMAFKGVEADGASVGFLSGGTERSGNRMTMSEVYWLLFMKHPWVSAAVRLIANTVANGGYDIVPVDGADAKPLNDKDDPRCVEVRTMIRELFLPTSQRRGFTAVGSDIKIFGCSYGLKKYAGKMFVGMERLDPRLVTPVPSKDRTYIEYFKLKQYNDAGYITATGDAKKIAPEQVVFFNLGGGDPLFGAPPVLESLDLTVALDLSIRRFREATMRNGATAGTILVNKDATEEEVRAAERSVMRTKQGSENAYKTWWLTGSWEVHSVAKPGGKEFDFVEATKLSREEVLSVFHVPPGKLLYSAGALGSSGKAEDDQTFQEQCVLPLEWAIFETLTADLIRGELGYDDLELVPKRINQLNFDMFDAAGQGVKFGMTGNEARKIVGLGSIDDPLFDMDAPLFLGHTGLTVASDEPLKSGETNGGAPQSGGGSPTGGGTGGRSTGNGPGKGNGRGQAPGSGANQTKVKKGITRWMRPLNRKPFLP